MKKRNPSFSDKLLADINSVGRKTNSPRISYDQYKQNGGQYREEDFIENYGSFQAAVELCGFKAAIE